MKIKGIKKVLISLVAVFGLVFFLTGCAKSNDLGSKEKPVKVGIIGSDDRVWKTIKSDLKKKGVNIKIVSFTNYDQPNQALASGDIDINAYQHIYFLDNWNKAHHTNLKPIGNTVIAPLAVFSKKIKNINDLKDGDIVALPNDATNQARSLQLLENAGLITLKKNVKFPTPNDVAKNPRNLKLKPLDAAQTARALDDATISIINNSTALDANLNYDDAIYNEKITPKSKIWINVIAADNKNKDNKVFKKVVKEYQSERIANKIKDIYKGSTIPAWNYKF